MPVGYVRIEVVRYEGEASEARWIVTTPLTGMSGIRAAVKETVNQLVDTLIRDGFANAADGAVHENWEETQRRKRSDSWPSRMPSTDT